MSFISDIFSFIKVESCVVFWFPSLGDHSIMYVSKDIINI